MAKKQYRVCFVTGNGKEILTKWTSNPFYVIQNYFKLLGKGLVFDTFYIKTGSCPVWSIVDNFNFIVGILDLTSNESLYT
jgi:hypothetical protein